MARYGKIFNNFTGGEIAPDVLGRTDLPQYQNGCEVLENFIPSVTGGARRRPGTILANSKDTWADEEGDVHPARMIPYVFSQEETYIIYLASTVLSGTINIYAVDDENFPILNNEATVTNNSTAGGYNSEATLREVKFTFNGNDIYLTHPDYKPLRIVRTSANNFTVYDYDDADLFDSVKDQIKVIPFQDVNTTSVTITPSATSGTAVALTSSADIQWGDYIRFDSGGSSGVAQITAVSSGTSAVCSTLTGFSFSSTSAQTDWYMSSWGALWPTFTSARIGYPRAVTFYQQRLAYGGNLAFPDTMWFSESANQNRLLNTKLDQWTAGVELQTGNAAAIQVTLASSEVNQILWMLDAGRGDLGVGTTGDEWVGFAPDTGSGFGPTNIRFDRQSSYGSADVQPVLADGVLVFIQKNNKTIRTLQFNDSAGKYISNDLTALAPHLVLDTYNNRETLWDYETSSQEVARFITLAYDTSFGCLWTVTSFGDVFCCAFSREFSVSAWSRQVLGGKYEFSVRDDPTQEQAPRVRSLCVLPGSFRGKDRQDFVFMAVTRGLNERIGTLIEYIAPHFERNTLNFSLTGKSGSDNTRVISELVPVYLDCAFAIREEPAGTEFDTTRVLGSTYQDEWRGVEVSVLADGKVLADVTVANDDTITLGDNYSAAVFGFKYTHKLKTTRIEQGSQIGTAQGLTHRIHKAIIRLYRSAQLKVGDPDETSKMEELTFDKIDGNSSNAIALFTGDKEVDMPSAHDSDPYVYIEGSDPLPLNIAAIIAKGEVYEG